MRNNASLIMAEGQALLEMSINDFFLRCGLTPQDQLDCYTFIERLYPGIPWVAASYQGYCSMTIFVGDHVVIQFRPDNYRLNLQIAEAAREVYGAFAPDTKHIATIPKSGLLVYSMNRIIGAPFKHFRESCTSKANSTEYRARLCVDFATFLSKGWHHSYSERIPLGIVGCSIIPRLKSLSTDLPMRFQAKARLILRELQQIEALPWVLSHGDIAAGNIIVDPSSGRLRGLVDWAEAERLPFGTCLYGLEEILGDVTTDGFQYHPHVSDLRDIFWAELRKWIPELHQTSVMKAVKLARDLGVLLWHGIAFDDGVIDRVVQEGRDVDEIRRLDAFLDLDEQESVEGVSKI